MRLRHGLRDKNNVKTKESNLEHNNNASDNALNDKDSKWHSTLNHATSNASEISELSVEMFKMAAPFCLDWARGLKKLHVSSFSICVGFCSCYGGS